MKIFRVFILIGFFTCSFFCAQAQFDQGDKLLNLGLGVNSPYSSGIPLHGSFEVGINDVISVGVGLDFVHSTYIYLNERYGFNALYPAGRVSYHFNKLFKLRIEELDIYGGGSLGFRVSGWTGDKPPNNYSSSYDSNIFATAHVGARWYFNPGFGVFAEVGAGGSSNARGGIVLRF